jgi:hypothetical protein
MTSLIQIAEPCHENWDAMTPNEQGRHCGSCCKTVVDFTHWEPEDILVYLQNNTNTCGRIPAAYLDTPIATPDTFVTSLFTSGLSRFTKMAAIFLFAFGLLSASCNTANPTTKAPEEQHQTTGMMIAPPPDTTNQMMLGETRPVSEDSVTINAIPVPGPISVPVVSEPSSSIMGDMVIARPDTAIAPPEPEPVIMGGISIPMPPDTIVPPVPEKVLMGEPAVVPKPEVIMGKPAMRQIPPPKGNK